MSEIRVNSYVMAKGLRWMLVLLVVLASCSVADEIVTEDVLAARGTWRVRETKFDDVAVPVPVAPPIVLTVDDQNDFVLSGLCHDVVGRISLELAVTGGFQTDAASGSIFGGDAAVTYEILGEDSCGNDVARRNFEASLLQALEAVDMHDDDILFAQGKNTSIRLDLFRGVPDGRLVGHTWEYVIPIDDFDRTRGIGSELVFADGSAELVATGCAPIRLSVEYPPAEDGPVSWSTPPSDSTVRCDESRQAELLDDVLRLLDETVWYHIDCGPFRFELWLENATGLRGSFRGSDCSDDQ